MGELRRLVLASASPRRRELLSAQGFSFDLASPQVDESGLADESVEERVARLALAKARHVHERLGWSRTPRLVLAADTLVALAARVLGKPRDPDEAVEMLTQLGGQVHRVLTGCALLCDDGEPAQTFVEVSHVAMTEISADAARRYVATGEPLDKAGSYALQGLGAAFVRSVEGSRSNVIGLPVEALLPRLAARGVRPTA